MNRACCTPMPIARGKEKHRGCAHDSKLMLRTKVKTTILYMHRNNKYSLLSKACSSQLMIKSAASANTTTNNTFRFPNINAFGANSFIFWTRKLIVYIYIYLYVCMHIERGTVVIYTYIRICMRMYGERESSGTLDSLRWPQMLKVLGVPQARSSRSFELRRWIWSRSQLALLVGVVRWTLNERVTSGDVEPMVVVAVMMSRQWWWWCWWCRSDGGAGDGGDVEATMMVMVVVLVERRQWWWWWWRWRQHLWTGHDSKAEDKRSHQH